MSRIGWITLAIAGTCLGFVVGAMVAKGGKSPVEAPRAPEEAGKQAAERQESGRVRSPLASMDKLRWELAEREEEIGDLRAELADVIEKLPPALTPEEEKKQKQLEGERRRNEAWMARWEKSKELSAKILQRRDKALRAEGLEGLAALLGSADSEEVLLGFAVLESLNFIPCDKERFQPQIVKALSHEDSDVRRTALQRVYMVSPLEQDFDALVPLAKDPSPEVRRLVVEPLGSVAEESQREKAASVLRSMLTDDDTEVRLRAACALWERPEYAQEMEDVLIQLSREAENSKEAGQIFGWLEWRAGRSAKTAQRVIEMYDQGQRGYPPADWVRVGVSDDAKPALRQFFVRVVRDSIDQYERRSALEALQMIGDPSAIPELQQVGGSDDAEGIEKELAETIEHLRRPRKGLGNANE